MSPHKDLGPMVREMRKEWLNMDNIVASSTDYPGFDEKLNKEILVQANRELICPAGDNYSGIRGNDVINLTTNTKTPPVTGMQLHTFMPGMLLSDRHMDGFKIGSVGVSVHWTKGLFGDTESSQCANRFMYINPLREPLAACVSTVSKCADTNNRNSQLGGHPDAPEGMIRFSFTSMKKPKKTILSLPHLDSITLREFSSCTSFPFSASLSCFTHKMTTTV